MIVKWALAVFQTVFIDPIQAVLPAYTTPGWMSGLTLSVVPNYLHAFDSIIPVDGAFHVVLDLIALGIVLIPVMAIVWLWGAVRP